MDKFHFLLIMLCLSCYDSDIQMEQENYHHMKTHNKERGLYLFSYFTDDTSPQEYAYKNEY